MYCSKAALAYRVFLGIFFSLLCAITQGQVLEKREFQLRNVDPQVVATVTSAGASCVYQIKFAVFLGGRKQAETESENCLGDNILSDLRGLISWRAPYLAIDEHCTGNSPLCDSSRALIAVSGNSARKIGTFNEFLYFEDKAYAMSLLFYEPYPFVPNALHHIIRYVQVIEPQRLTYSPQLTWVLNHEQFEKYYEHVVKCGPRRFSCQKSQYQPIEFRTAVLFAASVAYMTGRTQQYDLLLRRAKEVLGPGQSSELKMALDRTPWPK